MNFQEFKNKITSQITYGIYFKQNFFINFYNIPKEELSDHLVMAHGAYLENNRFAFAIRGFKEDNSNSDKIQVELSVCSSTREFKKLFRKKTSSPEKIAEYIIAFIKKIQSEIPTKSQKMIY